MMAPASRTKKSTCPHCSAEVWVEQVPAPRPPPELLSTNSPPSDVDARIFYAARADARARVGALTEQIVDIRKTLQSLIDEKDTLKTRIDEYDRVLHPLRSAPVDVLTHVFLACLDPTIYITGKSTSLDPRNMPWTLSQVSSRWRSISIDFPRLWSCITIDLGTRGSENGDVRKPVACLTKQLQRSMTHPLLVWINSEIHHQSPLLPVLMSSSPRWKQLSLMISLSNLRSLSSISGSIQSLRTLYFFYPGETYNDIATTYPLQSMFRSAPELSVVVASEPYHLQPFELPYPSVRDILILDAPSPVALLKTLRRAPNIESFTCQTLACDVDEELSFGTVELPYMRVLVLEDADQSSVLQHITAPSLNLLDITCHDDTLREALLTLINKSQPPLTTLKITSSTFTDDDCVRLLEKLPTLRSLTLGSAICTAKFTAQLNDKPSLAPLLEQLHVGTALVPIKMETYDEGIIDAMKELMTTRAELKIRLWKTDGVQIVSLD